VGDRDIVLRPTSPDDIAVMALIMDQASAARKGEAERVSIMEASPHSVDYLRERLSRAGSWSALALVAGKVAGFIAGNPVREDDDRLSSDCEDLGLIMVAPDSWGLGVGQALMSWAAELHRARGKKFLELWTQSSNPRARKLYERLGYTLIDGTKIRGGELMVRYRLTL